MKVIVKAERARFEGELNDSPAARAIAVSDAAGRLASAKTSGAARIASIAVTSVSAVIRS